MTLKETKPALGEQQNELNMHKFEELNNYAVRDLDCGITCNVHPQAEEISRATHEWLKDHDMHTLFDEKTFERFVRMDCPRVLSMTHPVCPFEGTLWIAKLVTMFFLADDYLETQCGEFAPPTPSHVMIEWNMIMFWTFPNDSDQLIADLLKLFKDLPEYQNSIADLCHRVITDAAHHPFGTAYPGKLTPCASGFLDLWQEAITLMHKQWGLRQMRQFFGYFCWHIRESFYRKQKKVPTVDEYVIHRTGSGGMQMLLGAGADFVEKNENFCSDEMFDSEKVQHLLNAANLASCLFNDIYSFPKELRNGEYHNMVFLVSHWRKCSYNEAGEIVMKMVEDINQDIVKTGDELKEELRSSEVESSIQPTIDACINSIPAHNVFHKTSFRYSFNKPLVVVLDTPQAPKKSTHLQATRAYAPSLPASLTYQRLIVCLLCFFLFSFVVADNHNLGN